MDKAETIDKDDAMELYLILQLECIDEMLERLNYFNHLNYRLSSYFFCHWLS